MVQILLVFIQQSIFNKLNSFLRIKYIIRYLRRKKMNHLNLLLYLLRQNRSMISDNIINNIGDENQKIIQIFLISQIMQLFQYIYINLIWIKMMSQMTLQKNQNANYNRCQTNKKIQLKIQMIKLKNFKDKFRSNLTNNKNQKCRMQLKSILSWLYNNFQMLPKKIKISLIFQNCLEKKKNCQIQFKNKKLQLLITKLLYQKQILVKFKSNKKSQFSEKLVKCIQNQILLQTKLKSTEEWFKKMIEKLRSTLPAQKQKYNQQQTQKSKPPPQVKKQIPKPKPIQKPKTAEQKQQQLKDKLDAQPIQRKIEMILRETSKIQSLILYYKTNLAEQKQNQIAQQLQPKKQICLKIVQTLQQGKNVPIANFYMNNLQKMITFDKFHGKSKKEYLQCIEAILKKYKIIEKNERQFNKKCSKSANEIKSAFNQSTQLLKNYQNDMQYLEQLKKKQYIPLPIPKLSLEQRSNFIQNSELQKNDLQFIIKNIEGLSQNCKMKIFFEATQNPRTTINVSNGSQTINLLLKMTNETIKQINKKYLELKFEHKKYLIFKKDVECIKIQFQEFMNKNTIQSTVTKDNIKITFQLNIKYPRNKLSKNKIQSISLVKYPEYVHTDQFQVDFVKKYIKSGQSVSVKPPQGLIYAPRNLVIINKLKTIQIEGISQDNIQRPQIYSFSTLYLTNQDKTLDKALNQIYEYKKNKQIIQQIQDQIIKKKMILEANLKNGKITPEKYIQMLETNLKNDKKLQQAYQNNQINDFTKFIALRMQYISFQMSVLKPKTKQTQIIITQKPIDISVYNLFYIKRNEQNKKILSKITQPIDSIEVDKIINPQKSSFSIKYLTQFDALLDKTINELVGDRLNKRFAQQLQNQIMKNLALINKKKSSINQDQYRALVKMSIQNDKKLIKIYKDLGINQFEKFIYAKIKVQKQQIGQKLFIEKERQKKQQIEQKVQQPKQKKQQTQTVQKAKQISFDINEQKQLFQIQRTQQINKIIQKFSRQLKNPEYPQYCQCVTYIQKMLQISKNQDLIASLTKTKEKFEQQMNNQTFDQQKYVLNLKKSREEDIQRQQAYKKSNLKDFYLFIKARLKIIDEELSNF